MPVGESVIIRDSLTNNGQNWASAIQVYETVMKAIHGKEPLYIDQTWGMDQMIQHLLLPKGTLY